MKENEAPAKQQNGVVSLFNQNNIKEKFEALLGKKSQAFITSVLQIASSNELLAKAEPISVYQAACVAATLDLPLNNNLGFAYIIPFNAKQKDGSYKTLAQFQLGYKGFIQLAQRSGQFKTIAASPIYEGQIISENPLTGYVFDFTQKKSETIVGYAAYFSLINGFEKTLYMPINEIKKHATKFSQTFKKGFGLWKDDFESMAQKTVIKLLLSKFAPLSIEMQSAVKYDQSVIGEDGTPKYIDNEQIEIDKEKERIRLMVEDCETIEEIKNLQENNPDFEVDLFNEKIEQIKNKK